MRKRPFSPVILLILVILSCTKSPSSEKVSALPQNSIGEWTSFRGNFQLQGNIPGDFPSNPQILWKTRLPEGIVSSPLIFQRKVLVATQDGRLVLLDLQTGKLLREKKLETSLEASPLIVGDRGYLGTLDGNFLAFDTSTLEILWTTVLGKRITGSANFYQDGERLILLVGSYDSYLYALGGEEGDILWKYQTGSFLNGTPLVTPGGGVVFGGCDGYLYKRDILKDRELWKREFGNYLAGSPSLLGERVVLGHYGGKALAFALGSGKVLWETQPLPEQAYFASPAVGPNIMVLGSRDGSIQAFDPGNGDSLWTFVTGGDVDSSPLLGSNGILVASGDTYLYHLNLEGELVWDLPLGEPVSASPAFGEGTLVLCGTDGSIWAIGERS